jgi:hypothetical protein
MPRGHRVAREGISAGPMRASAIAVWFAILDATRGERIVVPARRHARQGGTPGKVAASSATPSSTSLSSASSATSSRTS